MLSCREIALSWQSGFGCRATKLRRQLQSDLPFPALRLKLPPSFQLCSHAVSTIWHMAAFKTAPRNNMGCTAVGIYSVGLPQ